MKRIRQSLIIIASLLLFPVIGMTPGNCYASSVTLTGNGTLRAGDTLTVTMTVSQGGLFAVEGDLAYDSGILEYTGGSIAKNGWEVTWNGSHFLCEDSKLTSPTAAGASLMTFTFKVKNGAATGSTASVSVSNVSATDGGADYNLGVASYSKALSAPLSGNTKLSALSVEGLTLNPGFAAGTTTYSLGEVEYSVSKLNIAAKAEDNKATVAVSSTNLAVGENKITITVTAENGAKGTYIIMVVRKQDPNYVASNDASLSGITLSLGILSPAFSSDVTSYIVYLPFEAKGTMFRVDGATKDPKALGATGMTFESLEEGNNKLTVVGKAEDGSTKEYTVNVYVMPVFAGNAEGAGNINIPSDSQTEETSEDNKEPEIEYVQVEKNVGVKTWVLVVGILLALAVGAGAGVGGMILWGRRISGTD